MLITGMEMWGFSGQPDTFLACRALFWPAGHLLYIHFRSRLIPMVCKKLAWHKLYIQLRLQLNSAEFDGMFMACRAQALHPFSVSTEFDGMKKACLAQTLHPITPSAISDGASAQKCSNSLHPSTLSAISDGASAQKCSNSLHPFSISAISDGASVQKCSNSLHPFSISANSDGVLISQPLPVDNFSLFC